MRLILELTNRKDLEILLPLLKRLKINVVEKQESIIDEAEDHSSTVNEEWDFKKFYSSSKISKSLNEVDSQLDEYRKEWERNI